MAKTYSFEGKSYSFPDDVTQQEVLDLFESMSKPATPEPPKDQGFLEVMGKGFLETALGASKAYGGASEDTYKTAATQAEDAGQTQPIATALGRMAPVIGATVPAMVATPAAIAGMGTLAGMGTATALAAPSMAPIQGGSRYSEVLNKTGDEATALKAGIASGLTAAGTLALPMSAGGRALGAGLLGRMGEGAAINMVTGTADRALQNQITGDYSNVHQDLLDPTSLGVEAVLGSAFGGMSPKHVPTQSKPKVPVTPENLAPPPLEATTAAQLDRLGKQKTNLTSYIDNLITNDLPEAQRKAEVNPRMAWDVERIQRVIADKQLEIADLDNKLKLVTEGGIKKEPLSVASELETLTLQRKPLADEVRKVAGDWYEAVQKNSVEASMLEKAHNKLKKDLDKLDAKLKPLKRIDELAKKGFTESDAYIMDFAKGDTDTTHGNFTKAVEDGHLTGATEKGIDAAIKYRLEAYKKARGRFKTNLKSELDTLYGELDARKAQGATAQPLEATQMQGELPPYMPREELAQRGKESSVQTSPQTDVINSAFDPKKISTWSDEAIANSIARKESAFADSTPDSQVRANIQSELDILHSEQQRRSNPSPNQPKENADGLQTKGQGQEAPSQEVKVSEAAISDQLANLQMVRDSLLRKDGRAPYKNSPNYEPFMKAQAAIEELTAKQQVEQARAIVTEKKQQEPPPPPLPKVPAKQPPVKPVLTPLPEQKQQKQQAANTIARGLWDTNNLAEIKATDGQTIEAALSGKVTDTKGWDTTKNFFGKTQLVSMFNHPVIRYVGTVIRRHEHTAKALHYKVLNGIEEGYKGAGKRWIDLKRFVDEKSIATTWQKISNDQAADLHDTMQDRFNQQITKEQLQAEAKAADMPSKTDAELLEFDLAKRTKELRDSNTPQVVIDAYISARKGYQLFFDENNKSRALNGQSLVPFRPDYYHVVRKGQFKVNVFANDILDKVHQFRTEAEARLLMEKYAKLNPDYRVEFEDIAKTREGQPMLGDMMDFTTVMLESAGIDPRSAGILDRFDQMSTTGMKFGKHQEYRSNLEGYAGSEWFKTKDKRGAAFKEGIFDWVDEQVSIKKKGDIKFDTERLLSDERVEAAQPNATKFAKHIRDVATNSVEEWKWASAFDDGVRKTGDGLVHNIAKLFGKQDYFPQVAIADKTMGVMSSMFYMSTLTNRAGFWVSQVLTAPSSIRLILRDKEMPLLDIMKQYTKGSARSFGLIPHTAESAAFLRKSVNTTDSLTPQLTNELNQVDWFKRGSMIEKVMGVVTGKKPSELADVFSRIWTANTMYEHFQAKGLKGKDLEEAALAAVDETMVVYSRAEKGAWVGKAGLVGQAANPLMTFGVAQMGNLISDIKFAARSPKELRAYLPVLSTFAVTQLMAGAIGLPLLVEYQFIRDMVVGADPEYDGWMPDIKKIMLDQPAVLERGIPSAVLGFDVGSGMRWNPFLEKFTLNGGQQSLIDFFPALAFMGSVGKAVGMYAADQAGHPSTLADRRKAYMAVTPFVGGKAAVDAYYFDSLSRDMVPGGRSYGVVEQTTKENLSTFLGSRTVEKARAQDASYLLNTQNRLLASKKQKAVDMLLDSIMANGTYGDAALERMVDMGMTTSEIMSSVQAGAPKRMTSAMERWMQGGTGPAAMQKKLRAIQQFGTQLEEQQ